MGAITEDGQSSLASTNTALNEDNNLVEKDHITTHNNSENLGDPSMHNDSNALESEINPISCSMVEEKEEEIPRVHTSKEATIEVCKEEQTILTEQNHPTKEKAVLPNPIDKTEIYSNRVSCQDDKSDPVI